jgi:hypothetical protein
MKDTMPEGQYSIDPFRWGKIFALLSLDLVAPYVRDMRLQLPVNTRFMIELRHFLEKIQSVQDPAFASTVFEWLSATYDAEFVKHLVYWGVNVFQYDPADGGNAFLWKFLIVRAGNVDSAPPFIRFLKSKLDDLPRVEIKQKLPVTDWDKRIYEREGYDEITMETIESVVNHCSFVQAWAEAERLLNETIDYDVIHNWGIHVAQQLGHGGDEIGRPGIWPALPASWY